MERWQGKLAVVTGASGGIGAACARALITAGLRVVGLARREAKLHELKQSLPIALQPQFIPRRCDVSKEDQVVDVINWTERMLGGADVLLNNAGITRQTELVAAENTEKIRQGICPGAVNTNIFPQEIQFYVKDMARLQPENIADAVLYALRTPPHVQVHEITLKPMGEIF
ncbi:farnesol dehydrogenase isoform X2 [Eurosta solidaginis]|uniref:farnesol dehydrogenase isoform X2 n=1 Tax=Eurosta solidaginis TaxID=178769 RepID=UPI003530F7D8